MTMCRLCLLVLAVAAGLSVVAFAQEQAPVPSEKPTFAVWLDGVRREAVERGIRPATIETAFRDLRPVEVAVDRDRTQVEFVLPIDVYLKRRVSRELVRTGRRMLGVHRKLLDAVAARFGVEPQVVVAVWGLESNFGRFSGVRPIVPMLATLAYDVRRPALFRQELLAALTILDRGDVDLDRFRGSWAGALGQPQFMPSSYLKYAEDFDGDGRRDIWSTTADVFASIASYLTQHGWRRGERWGREVVVSKPVAAKIADQVAWRPTGCQAGRQMRGPLPLSAWNTLGVRLPGRTPLPAASMEASLLQAGKQVYLLYRNYDVLLDYNCAHAYALSVGLLADRVATGK